MHTIKTQAVCAGKKRTSGLFASSLSSSSSSSRALMASGIAALVCAGLLAGCSVLPAPPTRADVYDFGPGLMAIPPSDMRAPLPPIALAEVGTASGTPEGSSALLYRLSYSNAQQLRPYTQARWSLPPAQLVQQALRDRLGQRRAVLLGDDGIAQQIQGGALPSVVRVELEEFSQVFTAPTTSVGLVRMRASVAESSAASGERLLAQRVFVVQQPAATADAVGGANALAQAAAQAADELAQWIEQLGR